MRKVIEVSFLDDPVPPDSDIVLHIDFDPDEGSAARVFEIASDLIRSMEDMDRVLIGPIGTSIQTQLILEDLEKSSLKVFLRNLLTNTDDDALKDLDIKRIIGNYLVLGKYAAVKFLDRKIEEDEKIPIEDLTTELHELAKQSDIRQLPDYPKVNPVRLAQSMDGVQRAKQKFKKGEGLVITLGEHEYKVDTDANWLPSEHLPRVDQEQEIVNEAYMLLTIRKPDLLGSTKWQFQHGKRRVNAPIEDEDWIDSFHAGDYPLKPGDALRVRMRFSYRYDAKGDLIDSDEKIIKVMGVIHSASHPPELFDRPSDS